MHRDGDKSPKHGDNRPMVPLIKPLWLRVVLTGVLVACVVYIIISGGYI